MTGPIRVVVSGYGRLGAELARGLAQSPEVELAGIARRSASGDTISVAGREVPVGTDLPALLDRLQPRVLLEASVPGAAAGNARAALERGASPVVATSGLDDASVEDLRRTGEARGLGVVLAPNLSLGAVLLIHLSAIAGRYFDQAEVVEMHRAQKLDAPSGTALHTAREMARARGRPFTRADTETFTLQGVRGGEIEGIGIHSIRLPGLVAHQQVVFGGLGQTLTLRHDTTSNESYVPGALLAIKHAVASSGLTVGLAALLGLQDSH